MAGIQYTKGASLPDLQLWLTDSSGALIDFSSGWTFSAKVGLAGQTAIFTKSTGFTGAAGSGTGTVSTDTPNLTIQWAIAGELDQLAGDTADGTPYQLNILATRNSDSRVRKYHYGLNIFDIVL